MKPAPTPPHGAKAVTGKDPLATLAVADTDAGQRVDRLLKNRFAEVPYVAIQKLLRQGRVRLNGAKTKPDARVAAGDVLSFPADFGVRDAASSGPLRPRQNGSVFVPTDADVDMIARATLFEDRSLLVINKPAGLPAQAGGGQVRSLDRILAAIYGPEKAPKLVHRLDRETTGLIVCAKNRTMAAALSAQFSGREVEKEYLALVAGDLPGVRGRIEKPILKTGAFAKVDARGDKALTTWRLLHSFAGEALHLIACTPHTGRMNQLRVHFADAGFPIVGDDKYAFEIAKAAGRALHPAGAIPLYLHAWHLSIAHPQTGAPLQLTAPPPIHFAALTARGLHASILGITGE